MASACGLPVTSARLLVMLAFEGYLKILSARLYPLSYMDHLVVAMGTLSSA